MQALLWLGRDVGWTLDSNPRLQSASLCQARDVFRIRNGFLQRAHPGFGAIGILLLKGPSVLLNPRSATAADRHLMIIKGALHA